MFAKRVVIKEWRINNYSLGTYILGTGVIVTIDALSQVDPLEYTVVEFTDNNGEFVVTNVLGSDLLEYTNPA